ncbi:hypothetical protein LTR66_001220 [Elasticomyces elasticus]|nr:hypothetical protein LTR66_001220 [Elasticomyces elasticus]
MPYEYRTPPLSPCPVGGHGYYSPRYPSHTATPSPRGSPRADTRRASHEHTYTYTTPRTPTYYTIPAGYSSPGYYTSAHTTPQQRKPDYVSNSDRIRSKTRRFWIHAVGGGSKRRNAYGNTYHPARSHYVQNIVFDDYGDEYLPAYDYQPPPPYERHQSYREAEADHYAFHDQVPIYTPADEHVAHRSRARRASHTAKPHHLPPKPRTSAAKPPPKATDEDARRAGIPAGYSFKNWDPAEEPILLLGSVFDANSLGKWIYDWAVFFFGPATPMSEVAGDLWLLLIQLAGKMKRAEEIMPRIRAQENREVVEDFLDAGERLWERFNRLLKICENFMWKAAKRERGNPAKVTMGKNSGCEFVDSLFGRDRELERTEKLMTGMRLWGMRFDANCEEILRHPSA